MTYEQEMTAPAILSLFDTTKDQRASFVADVIARLDTINPLDLHLQVKCMEEIIESLKGTPEYKSAILDEADKYPGKKFNHRHAEFTKMEAGVKYNYLMCGDAEYDRLHAEGESIKEKLKARETFLKSIPSEGITQVEEMTGEVVKIYPPSKTSTTTVSVKLK